VEDIAAWLDSLAAKSLLSVSYRTGGRRYRLLDSTRGFAREQLRANGERHAARAGYARYLLDLFEQAEAEWTWRTREDWTARYGHWANDLRRAIDWAFDEGGDPELGIRLTAAAIPLWNEFSSVVESRVRVESALDALDRLSTCDSGLRLKLIAAHGSNLQFSKRLGGEAESVWVDGWRLAVKLGNIEFQLRTQFGLAGLQFFTGRHRDALSTLARLAEFIERETDRSAAPDAERLRLKTLFHCGDIREARAGLESLERDNVTVANRSRISRFQLDRFVAIRNALAIASWVAGDQRRGLALVKEAVDSATALDHPVSLTYTLGLTAIPLSLWSGALDAAQDQVSRLARTLTLHQIDTWPPFARLFQAAIDSARGDGAGVDRMRAAIDELIANNVLLRTPIYLAMLAEAALRHGRTELARASIAEAFERADRQDEHWSRAELVHIRGLVQWRDGDPSGAEQSLRLAAQVAAESGALTYELRATASLARLLVREKRGSAAAQQLARVSDRFDGGADSADVIAARDLLGGSPEGS
jgi:predicted ATPase